MYIYINKYIHTGARREHHPSVNKKEAVHLLLPGPCVTNVISHHENETTHYCLQNNLFAKNKKMMKIILFAYLSFSISSVSAFGTRHVATTTNNPKPQQYRISLFSNKSSKNRVTRLFSKEDDLPKGMEDAFRQLEDLNSLGGDSFTVPEKKQDEAFAKAMQELDLQGIEDAIPSSPEAEAALYSDMAIEISGVSEIDLIDKVKSEMGGSKTAFPQFDPTVRETEMFMEKALDEALDEAKRKGDYIGDKESILDNKEIMKEIEGIFDRANEQLLEGLEDIRSEQVKRNLYRQVSCDRCDSSCAQYTIPSRNIIFGPRTFS
jgi:hypothetical protein